MSVPSSPLRFFPLLLGALTLFGALTSPMENSLVASENTSNAESQTDSDCATAEAPVFSLIRPETFQGPNELERFTPHLRGKMNVSEDGKLWSCEITDADLPPGLSSEQAMNAAVWSVSLNQKEPQPLFLSCESQFSGPKDARGDYSLYVDAIYADGSPQWGIKAIFNGNAPLDGDSWETAFSVFCPEKPIKSLTCYCLFRNRLGNVKFRSPKIIQANPDRKNLVFDGLGVWKNKNFMPAKKDSIRFYLRDVEADSDWFALQPVANSQKGDATIQNFTTSLGADSPQFSVSAKTRASQNGILFDSLKIRSLKPVDRCVTLVAAIPAPDVLHAFLGLDKTEAVSGKKEISSSAFPTDAGMKRLSRFPIQGVASASSETWFGLNPFFPAVYRTFFNPFANELCIAFDLGFIPEKTEWELHTCRFSQPNGGMRRAWKTYYDAFPDAFRVRVPKMGNWMAFAPISQVKDPQDFGFAFKEGIDEPDWDDQNEIITFRYTEPMTWWMKFDLPAQDEETDEERVAKTGRNTPKETLLLGAETVKRLAKNGDKFAKSWDASVMHDENGTPRGLWLDTPWCRGIVWSLSGLPNIPGDSDFKNKWSDSYVQKVYPKLNASANVPLPGPGIDGEYVDSAEGYVTAQLDFRKEHLPHAETPLTFSLEHKTPVIFRGLTTFEYVRGIEKDVHAAGKLMMANSTPFRIFWLAPLLDVMGTESNWNWNGKWSPMSIEELQYRRMLCYGKPFCFLQNTDFSDFTYELSEKFMQRSLAFGMFPSFFSADASTKHYFRTPDLYERDRPLFKKYLPLCRMIAEAGWEPLTGVRVKDARLLIERFGDPEDGRYFLTIFNPEKEPISAELADFEPNFKGKVKILAGSFLLAPESTLLLEITPEN